MSLCLYQVSLDTIYPDSDVFCRPFKHIFPYPRCRPPQSSTKDMNLAAYSRITKSYNCSIQRNIDKNKQIRQKQCFQLKIPMKADINTVHESWSLQCRKYSLLSILILDNRLVLFG